MSTGTRQLDPIEPTKTQYDRMEHIIKLSTDLLCRLEMYTLDGRYRAISETKLEEFVMFANKAICREGKE